MLSVEKVTSQIGFTSLEPQWNALLKSSQSDTIALTHEWLTTWWEVFGEGREFYLLVVRDGEEIIGIAPLLKRPVHNLGIPFQRLEFLASGECEADEICSDYLDFIIQQGREAQVLEAIFGFLSEHEDEWDELSLKEIQAQSPTLLFLQQICRAQNLKCIIAADGEAIYLPLTADWDSLVARYDKKLRHQMRRDRNLAQSEGHELRVASDSESFDEAFATLIQLHQKSWTSRGKPGAFASENFSRFHRNLAARLLPKGQIRVAVFRAQGAPVAATHYFVYRNKAYYYQTGFDPDSPIRSSGTLIRNLSIHYCITEGLEEWDFLRAEPTDKYKYRWSKETRPIVQVRIAKPQAKEVVFASAHNMVNSLRKVKRSLKR